MSVLLANPSLKPARATGVARVRPAAVKRIAKRYDAELKRTATRTPVIIALILITGGRAGDSQGGAG